MISSHPTATLPSGFFTREAFAAWMGYSLRTVDELIARRGIEFHKKGRNVRIPHEAALVFWLKHRVLPRDGVQTPVVLSAEETSLLKRLLEPLVSELLERRQQLENKQPLEAA